MITIKNMIESNVLDAYNISRYSHKLLAKHENLSDHLSEVAVMSALIGLELQNLGSDIDMSSLLLKAIFHDIEETVTSDIPRPVKYLSSEVRDMFKVIEDNGMKQLLSSLDISYESKGIIYDIWSNSKKELCGEVVKLVDFLSVVKKVYTEYYILNNNTFLEIANNILRDLNNYHEYLLSKIDSDKSHSMEYKYLYDIAYDAIVFLDNMISK